MDSEGSGYDGTNTSDDDDAGDQPQMTTAARSIKTRVLNEKNEAQRLVESSYQLQTLL